MFVIGESSFVDRSDTSSSKSFSARLVYNSNVNPGQIDALLAKKACKSYNFKTSLNTVTGRTVRSKVNSVNGTDSSIVSYYVCMACKRVSGGVNTATDGYNALQNKEVNTRVGGDQIEKVEVKKSPNCDPSKTGSANENVEKIQVIKSPSGDINSVNATTIEMEVILDSDWVSDLCGQIMKLVIALVGTVAFRTRFSNLIQKLTPILRALKINL